MVDIRDAPGDIAKQKVIVERVKSAAAGAAQKAIRQHLQNAYRRFNTGAAAVADREPPLRAQTSAPLTADDS